MIHARTNFQQTLTVFAILLLTVVLSAGCAKKKNEEGHVDENFAMTPLSPSQACGNGTTYQGNAWAQMPHAQMNITPYGYGIPGHQPNRQQIANQGYCGCQPGTQAMCDSAHGVVCMPVDLIANQNVAWFHPSVDPRAGDPRAGQIGFQFSGFGGYTGYTNIFDPRTNLPPPTHYGHYRRPFHQQPQWDRRHQRQPQIAALSCSTQIGQTCTVGVNSCGHGAFCRPVAQGYSIGICAR